MNAMIVTTMMLPSRSVRKRFQRLSAPPGRASPLAGPWGAAPAGLCSEATAMAQSHPYDFVTPAELLVPSYRLFVLLYGATDVLSRNFRPVLTSAWPVIVW